VIALYEDISACWNADEKGCLPEITLKARVRAPQEKQCAPDPFVLFLVDYETNLSSARSAGGKCFLGLIDSCFRRSQ
jgi:hypothetical protein